VHAYLLHDVFNSFACITRNGTAGPYSSIFSFLRKLHTGFVIAGLICFPTNSVSLHPCCICFFPDDNHYDEGIMELQYSFDLHFPKG
jgi:hypothetical protein